MSGGPARPRFHEARRDGMPTDVGLFWEPDADELARRLDDSEADRAVRLARIEEIWADRNAWIDRYNAVDANQRALACERDALMVECAGLRDAVVQARELRAREHRQRDQDSAVAGAAAAAERRDLIAERDALAATRDALAAEREAFVAERAELQGHIAAVEGDRAAVSLHRDALAADRDRQVAAREAADARSNAVARDGATRLPLSRLRRIARRLRGP